MIDVNVIPLENNNEYMIVDTLVVENNNYLVLSNTNNNRDICIRKVITENGKEYVVKLDTDEEFNNVMTAFNEKHKRKGENNE